MNDLIDKIISNNGNIACFAPSCEGIDYINYIDKPMHWSSHNSEVGTILRNLALYDYNYMDILVAKTNMASEFKVFIINGSENVYKVWQLNVYPYSKELSIKRYFMFYKDKFAPSTMIVYTNNCLGVKHYNVKRLFDIISARGKDFKKEYSKYIIGCGINLFEGLDDFKRIYHCK